MTAAVAPETRYALLGDARIAYQVVGAGPPDLVLSAGTFGSVDLDFEDPMVARQFSRIARFCRLVRFDRRGSGASDPLPPGSLPPSEAFVDEVLAVMDAVGSRRTALMGMFDAGPMAVRFAAEHPGRTAALVLANTAARLLHADDYPWGVPPERAEAVVEQMVSAWGSQGQVDLQVPSRASDDHFRRWFARYTRSIGSPGAVRAAMTAMLATDVRSALPAIRVPVLVLHRRDYALFRLEHGRYLADHIPEATLVELPGRDGPLPWEHPDLAVDALEHFLTGAQARADPERVLATILFTDIVGSTRTAAELGDQRWRELLDQHDATARRVVAEHGGRLVETTGDGVLAAFDGPGHAIPAVLALGGALRRLGLEIRAGVHTGEVEMRGSAIGGLAVHIGARVMQQAGPGEVLVSRTVQDILIGSPIRLTGRGPRRLKGVPGEWELFAVVT